MSDKLVVSINRQPTLELPLQPRMLRLGSDASCELQISHPEVASLAAMVDYRGGTYFFQNCNSFDVYLDEQPISPNAWTPWGAGQQCYLTRSVSLLLVPDAGATVASDTAHRQSQSLGAAAVAETTVAPDKYRKSYQLLGILLCVALGGYFLSADNREPAETMFTFTELVEELDKRKSNHDDEVVLRYLQEAWAIDRRQGRRNPGEAVRAYHLLLSHRNISTAENGGSSVESKIKSFASQRIGAIAQGRS